ncbi:hypothetical protein H4R34_003316 [Dimargaris verticillata]|uniref:Uncharacterized protein n=1 Tax=Dimargaris verticillata TaxID=2761393 RepID=A0A9W8B7S2_9FUNG|nr:hypothetical protein H4R34_003316 [Dimargaris verticillata]
MDKLNAVVNQTKVSRARTIILAALLFLSVAALVVGVLGLVFRPKKKYLYYVGFGFGFWVVLLLTFYYQYRKRHVPLTQGPPLAPPPQAPLYDAYGRPLPYGYHQGTPVSQPPPAAYPV